MKALVDDNLTFPRGNFRLRSRLNEADPTELETSRSAPHPESHDAQVQGLIHAMCVHSPVGTLVLDADLRIVYANPEAVHLIARWQTGSGSPYKAGVHLAVPDEVAAACGRLWTERGIRDEFGPPEKSNLGLRIEVENPKQPALAASVVLLRIWARRPVFGFGVFLRVRGRRGDCPWEKLALLSPMERRVALLVAEGRPNCEVAMEQRTAVATVKAQLSSIYRKLGVRGRSHLASMLS